MNDADSIPLPVAGRTGQIRLARPVNTAAARLDQLEPDRLNGSARRISSSRIGRDALGSFDSVDCASGLRDDLEHLRRARDVALR
jgi:hypothetical protein